jgi:two-component system, NtrC family, response regulator AtoC
MTLEAWGQFGNWPPSLREEEHEQPMTKSTLSNGPTTTALKAAHSGPKPAVSFQRRVLIAEDNELTCRQLKELLESEGDLHVDTTRDGRQALEALRQNFYSIFLTDLKMPHLDGMQLIEEIRKQDIPVTTIVMTGHGSIEQAVQAMSTGAYHFLTKPLNHDHLKLLLRQALNERALRDEVVYLREQLQTRDAFKDIISKSPRMQAILELVNHIAYTTTTVLLEGETGTGKELIARAIHQASASLRRGQMVAINCAALPETLLESELFGHEKGAFTGAISQRKGRFEQANGGTLLLDEVGEIPPAMQVKLLRVLQERRFERVGGTEPIEVDVRIIAATNRSLARMVKKQRFREDLFFRINVIRIELPPLRERPEDIPVLVEHFSKKFARPNEAPKRFSPPVMEVLLNHRWPGNVRELENIVERVCVTCQDNEVLPEHLPPDLLRPAAAKTPFRIDLQKQLPELLKEITADVEGRYIRKALAKTRGNVGRCAKICGLSRRSITSKIAEYGIRKEELREQ